MATTTEILRITSDFLLENLSQPDLRHRISSISHRGTHHSPIKPLSLAAETIENAISTSNASLKTSSLRLAEEILLSLEETPLSSYLLSLVYSLCDRPTDAGLRLLHVFCIDPWLARSEIAPHLFEEMFLRHLLPVVQWYNEQRSRILDSDCDSDDQSVVSGTRLSTMSGDQASELKDLERKYEDILDENCRVFAEYFMEVLQSKEGDQLLDPPSVALEKNKMAEKSHHCEDEKAKTDGFRFKNGRYNPIWTDSVEGGGQVEDNSNTAKNLSKFPSFYPERVSPRAIVRQRSSKKSKKSLNSRFDYRSDESYSSDNLSDSTSSDSEAEKEEKNKKMSPFHSGQSKTKKQGQPLLGESSRPPDPFMEDFDSPLGNGKHTPPKDFVCPITTQVMYDPVTLETGQTYERKAIQEWLKRGNSTCPITRHRLHNTQLPKTNYVLKRLIASWQEQHPSSAPGWSENSKRKNETTLVFHGSARTRATIDGTGNDLRLAITNLCTSEVLKDAEMAVLQIEKFLQEANPGNEILTMLSKPPVINGFVEILFNSVDPYVLKATIFLLAELGSREYSVIQTLTRVDSDVECIVALFKKGLQEAVVLICLLKPFSINYLENGMLGSLLAVLNSREENLMKMCMKPKTASVIVLGQYLRTSEEEENASETFKLIVSAELVESIIGSLESDSMEERKSAVLILLRCMQEDGECRNVIADKAELTPVLESFIEANDEEKFEIVRFLSELVKLNRTLIEQLLHIIKNEGTYSTMHSLLIYLQNAVDDQCPIVAGLLLQLDLLVEPRKMSIYREEAIDALISCLRNSDSPPAQMAAAETILSLQGRFSFSGKPLLRAHLLKLAGTDRSNKSLTQNNHHANSSEESPDNKEEERDAEEWERKIAFCLVGHEFGLLFEALAEGLRSRYEDIFSACFVSAAWLIYMIVDVLPDTGIRGAARACLLKPFVSIFQSSKDTEDKLISLLALNSFSHDPEGMHDLTGHMKDILRGLRELKKSSRLAVDMLKLFSEEQESSAELWNHKEIVQEDCSVNGEVLSIVCYGVKVFSGHSDGTIKAWALKGGVLHLIQETQEHAKAVTSLAILQSTEKLYSGSLDKTVRVWSISNGGIQCEQVHEVKDHVHNLVVSNSTSCIIPQGYGVKVHSWSGGSKLLNQQKYAKCLALLNDKLYCGCHDNSIQEIDLASGTVHSIQSSSRKLLGKSSPIHAIQAFEGLIYSAGSSLDGAAVKIWNASSYSMVGSLASTVEIRAIAVSSDLIYLGGKGGAVEVWCRRKQNRVETLQTGTNAKVICMALDSDEEVLVIGTSDGKIQAWGLS